MSAIEGDLVESVLDGLGVTWKKRETGWVIPATARTPCEIDITLDEDELLLEAVLVRWETIGPRERLALSTLLETARQQMPEVWFMISEQRASVIATVPALAVERGLRTSIQRIQMAMRLLSRETTHLLEADIANRYLRFFDKPVETLPGGERI